MQKLNVSRAASIRIGLLPIVVLGFLLWQNWKLNTQVVHAQVTQHGVSLSWTASVSPNVKYVVYRSTTRGGPYSQLNAAPVAGLTYFDPTGSLNGSTVFYVVNAIDNLSIESAHSNEITAVTVGDPKAPTNLVGAAN